MFKCMSVQVETTNLCNAHCIFCPRHLVKELGTMDEQLYRKIVDEAATIPNLQTFIPMGYGEPLMDPDIIDRVQYACHKIYSPTVVKLYTNGILLEQPHIRALLGLRNFELSISINGVHPDTRQRLMGHNDSDHCLEMWQYAREHGMRTDATMVADDSITKEEMEAFILQGGTLTRLANWAGQLWDCPSIEPSPGACSRATSFVYLMWTGQMPLCCFDPVGVYDFGNVRDSTIMELWESPERQEIAFKVQYRDRKGLKLCGNCMK